MLHEIPFRTVVIQCWGVDVWPLLRFDCEAMNLHQRVVVTAEEGNMVPKAISWWATSTTQPIYKELARR